MFNTSDDDDTYSQLLLNVSPKPEDGKREQPPDVCTRTTIIIYVNVMLKRSFYDRYSADQPELTNNTTYAI